MSTVDTIARPGAFGAFAERGRELDADVTLAVAPPPDDEKPLLVRVTPSASASARGVGESAALDVETIGPKAAGSPWATAGYYAVHASILREADEARRDGLTALRLFLERLSLRGYRLKAVPVAAGVDVDRPADIRAAEAFLGQVGA